MTEKHPLDLPITSSPRRGSAPFLGPCSCRRSRKIPHTTWVDFQARLLVLYTEEDVVATPNDVGWYISSCDGSNGTLFGTEAFLLCVEIAEFVCFYYGDVSLKIGSRGGGILCDLGCVLRSRQGDKVLRRQYFVWMAT